MNKQNFLKPDYKNWMPKGMIYTGLAITALFLILFMVFGLHDIFSKSKYGDMQAFMKKLKDMGYEKVELIDSTGRFMTKWEAIRMGLSGSALLVGRK